MEAPNVVPSRYELQSLICDKLNIGVTPMQEMMIHGIEETIVEAYELGFHFANTGTKSAISASLK